MIAASHVAWPRQNAESLGDAVLRSEHDLTTLGLFDDTNLLKIFDSHPRDQLLIYTMGNDHTQLDDFRFGSRGDLSSDELLEQVKQGRLWLNILDLQFHHAEFHDLINGLYDELESKTPGFKAHQRSANLLVSSPTSQVYYHADAPLNMLWHLRGKKRVWVYPPNDFRFASAESLEKIFSGETEDDLPYDPGFDDVADIFDLSPGDMLTWPQNTPHRIENQEGLNVSMTTEHYTYAAYRRRTVFMANYYFRRWFHLPMRSTRTEGAVANLKRLSYRLCRQLPLPRVERFQSDVAFEMRAKAQS